METGKENNIKNESIMERRNEIRQKKKKVLWETRKKQCREREENVEERVWIEIGKESNLEKEKKAIRKEEKNVV